MPAHHGSATARRPNPPSPTRTRETLNPPSPRSGSSARTSPPSRGTPRNPGRHRRAAGPGRQRPAPPDGTRPAPLNTPLGELRQITPRTPPGSCLFAIDQNTTSTAALAAGDCCCAAAPPGPSPRAGSSGARSMTGTPRLAAPPRPPGLDPGSAPVLRPRASVRSRRPRTGAALPCYTTGRSSPPVAL